MDGVLDNGESNPYFVSNSTEFANVRNLNSTDNMELLQQTYQVNILVGFYIVQTLEV